MRILAVDSSHLRASVAVVETSAQGGMRLLAGQNASMAASASESLLPLIDEALRAAGIKSHQLDAFAAGVGPGSFTGIRIGLATVKTLAQALNKQVASISSLLALGLSADPVDNFTAVAMANAYQGQVFIGWHDQKGQWQEQAQLATEWMAFHLEVLKKPLIFVGPGADLYQSPIEDHVSKLSLTKECRVQTQVVLTPGGLARALEFQWARNGNSIFANYSEVKANYIRPSQATLNLEKHKLGLVRS